MMRIILALIAGLLGTAAGFRQAAALQAENARLQRWTEILRHLALLISESMHTLPEAFTLAASGNSEADGIFRSLAEEMQRKPREPLPALWLKISEPFPESPILSRLIQRLSHGTLESRQQAAEQAANELELLAAQTREKAFKDAKMWRTLGFLGGACITIMLL